MRYTCAIRFGLLGLAFTLSQTTHAAVLYDANPLATGWFDGGITSLADDTQLAVAGPVTLTGVVIGFYGTFGLNDGITATVNFYQRLGPANGNWTRGGLLGSSATQQIVGSSFFDVFFNLNNSFSNGDLVTEILFHQAIGGDRGVSVNQTATVGYSNDSRIQEDGFYVDYSPTAKTNMRVVLHGQANAVPEPFTLALGFAAAGAFVRRRVKNA